MDRMRDRRHAFIDCDPTCRGDVPRKGDSLRKIAVDILSTLPYRKS
ncbi:hypothetical protein RSSM_01747 [Rhodopirellula sallentina SM41]|uniref:Uncharacterized protein n=1 Tax=Rhodopirellula sallentina SM41 TaxID=1263870 RepID=M5U6C0_9BACT|nr:hypothetical protein RSSM_01747 [Rhodopirellula sallentina SM41]